MQQIFAEHAARYPEMTAQDYIKLAYQSEFGGGHLIADRDAALNYLIEEMKTAPKPAIESERIGGLFARLYIPAEGLRPETVLGLFLETCAPFGNMIGLNSKLKLLEKRFPEEVRAYREAGCPAMRHSEAYRKAYSPAYRLVPENALRFLPLFRAIDRLLEEKPFVRIAIEGQCASGKSTLGELLARVYGANLFHMDDYFLPFARKTPERLAEPGGNVDYERFYEEIASRPAGESVTWRRFDCSDQALEAPETTEPTRLTIVEGSYSMHPALQSPWDLSVFLSIDPARQSGRILGRNGEEMHEIFIRSWIPMENTYFDAFGIREKCDLVFEC